MVLGMGIGGVYVEDGWFMMGVYVIVNLIGYILYDFFIKINYE